MEKQTGESGNASGVWRVLVVDDNADAADSLAMLLTLQGHVVKAVHGAREALEIFEDFEPQIALLDIALPQMDGYELARRFRASEKLSAVRLIALTGYGRTEDRIRAREAGFDHHLLKPVDLDDLQRMMEESN